MAAPTSVRVEADSATAVTVRWTYGGSHSIAVYRSTDGISYSLVGAPVPVGTTSFTDVGLAADTKYWYKLSDDVGATFSSVVTVVTQDCQSIGGTGLSTAVNLPRSLTPDRVEPQIFSEAMERIEGHLNRNESQTSEPCPACVDSEGKVVIDCTDGCEEFTVDLTQDVNSITYKNCKKTPTVHWECPGNRVDCGVCGWPGGSPFSGDECTQARVGPNRTVTTGPNPPRSHPGGNNPRGGGGGAGGTTCECVPGKQNSLAIKCCTADCSMSCSSTQTLAMKVCGGTGPYTISATGSVAIKRQDGSSVGSSTIRAGEQINITPPTNSGSGVAGVAYIKAWYSCNDNPCPGGVCTGTRVDGHNDFGCNDAQIGGCFLTGAGHVHCATVAPAASTMQCSGVGASCLPVCASECVTGVFATCDDRTAGMIASGCNPCGISAAGKVVTVTDSLGNSTTKVLGA